MGVLTLLVGAYAALVGMLFVTQNRLLYLPQLPSREVHTTPRAVGLPYQSVVLTTEDGLRLDAWLVPAQPSRGALLFCHGNAGNISHRLDSLAIFHRLGLTTLIFDYRGYGRSQGEPSELGTYRDAEAGWRYLTESQRIPSGEIILFGRSLGAAVAAELATRHTPGALILESAFTSIPDLAAELYPFLPARWLARLRYPTEARLAAVRSPVLIVHSREDELIAFNHARRLYAAAREPKRLLPIQGGHNEGFLLSGEVYTRGLAAFLEEAKAARLDEQGTARAPGAPPGGIP